MPFESMIDGKGSRRAVDMFLQYAADLFVRPRCALHALHADPRRIVFGLLGHFILAAVYCVGISAALALNVAHVPQFLVITIPAEQYYALERWFILPVGMAGTILSSGAIRLVAQAWNGQGRFEGLFALQGFSLIVVAVVMGLPDLAIPVLKSIGILGPTNWTSVGLHVWLGTVWYLLLTVLAVKEAERLPWRKTFALALIGFAANGVVQFVFIR